MNKITQEDFVFNQIKVKTIKSIKDFNFIASKKSNLFPIVEKIKELIINSNDEVLNAKNLDDINQAKIILVYSILQVINEGTKTNKNNKQGKASRDLILQEAKSYFLKNGFLNKEYLIHDISDKMREKYQELVNNGTNIPFFSDEKIQAMSIRHRNQNTEKNKTTIQDFLDKYNILSISIEQTKTNDINLLIQDFKKIDKALDTISKKLGIKHEFLGINGQLSFKVSENSNKHWGEYDNTTNCIIIPRNTTTNDEYCESTLLHEWIHALDQHILFEITNLKFTNKRENKPTVLDKDLFALEENNPFFIHPQDFAKQYPYLIIRDNLMSLLVNDPNKDTRIDRNKEILKDFYNSTLGNGWEDKISPEKQDIMFSEIAYMTLKSSVFSKIKQTDTLFNDFLTNTVDLPGNYLTLIANKLLLNETKDKLKNSIKDNESLLNKSGSQFLKNIKEYDKDNFFKKSGKEISQDEIAAKKSAHNINIKNPEIAPVHFIGGDTVHYYQNPSEILARYFEKNVFSDETTNNAKKNNSLKIYPPTRDLNFEAKKDSLFVSIFGFECLAPRINNPLKTSVARFNEMVQTCESIAMNYNQQIKESINPTEDLIVKSIEYRNILNSPKGFNKTKK